jgi:hypothetical protein
MAAVVPNPHALADWGIWTGRLPLDGREDFLVKFSADPVSATAGLLTKHAQREPERPCPLFSDGIDSRFSPIVKRGHLTRRIQRSAVLDVTMRATDAAISALGADPTDPTIRAKVNAALSDLAAEQRRAIARRRKAKEQERRRFVATASQEFNRQLAELWDDEPTAADRSDAYWADLEGGLVPIDENDTVEIAERVDFVSRISPTSVPPLDGKVAERGLRRPANTLSGLLDAPATSGDRR